MPSVMHVGHGWLCPRCTKYVGFHSIHEKTKDRFGKAGKTEYEQLDCCKRCKMKEIRSKRERLGSLT